MAATPAPIGTLGTLGALLPAAAAVVPAPVPAITPPTAAGAAMAAPATAAATAKDGEGPTFEKPGVVKERLLLATLQEQIKARAAAPEKLKTTGVAFQAVEDVRREKRSAYLFSFFFMMNYCCSCIM